MARIVFFGTPELSVPTLDALCDNGHEVVLVVSQADKRRGRRGDLALTPTPVKVRALERGLQVTSRVKDVLDVDADLGVLVAFGRIIKPEILDHLNILNLHPSLLPRWRGATPAEAAILAGDEETGICVMQLANGMDAGDIYACSSTKIDPCETAASLYDRLFRTGNEMLIKLLQNPLPEPVPQVGEPTYCGKLSAEDFHIDWSDSAQHIERLTRIGRPWTTFRGKRLIIVDAEAIDVNVSKTEGMLDGVRVATGSGALRLTTVQPEGKKQMDAAEWVRGLRITEGERLGEGEQAGGIR